MIRYVFILVLAALPLQAEELKVCDPENTQGFAKKCGETPEKSKPGVLKIPLWQGTEHKGFQLFDCKNGTIKNVIEKTGESYACRVPTGK